MNCNQNITIPNVILSFVSTELSQIYILSVGGHAKKNLAYEKIVLCYVVLYIKYRDTAVVCKIP